MGVTLTGKAIKDTYQGMLKFSDNNPMNANFKNVTDGFGNASGLFLSATGVTAKRLYNNQTIAQITAVSDVNVVATREYVLSQTAAATSFLALTDTPSVYTNFNYMNVKVNTAGNAIAFTPDYYDWACGDETSDIAVGTAVTMEFPRPLLAVSGIQFTCTTAPVGADIIIDVRNNGTSIYSGVLPHIDAGTTSSLSSIQFFPLTGFNEVRYSEKEKKVIYEPVKLEQNYRDFDFDSPWEGTKYIKEIKEKNIDDEKK